MTELARLRAAQTVRPGPAQQNRQETAEVADKNRKRPLLARFAPAGPPIHPLIMESHILTDG